MPVHPTIAAPLAELVATRRARLEQVCGAFPAAHAAIVDRVLLASDFAYEQWLREPAWLAELPRWLDPADTLAKLPVPTDDEAPAALRRHRRRECVRIIVRDVAGIDTVERTLADLTALAEDCMETALRVAEAPLVARYGVPRGAGGEPQRLVVFGMGKLGGGELNFSSDIDLIFAFAEPGACDGASALDSEEFFTRLGRRFIQLLSDVTSEGFVYRVDMRLRPFGASGRLVLPFAAMEQYYQREGRDWERYAWVKARAVAGDRAAGARLSRLLEPFVYRRYLDYGAIDGLREFKARIDAEVARRELADHVKLGPGGIRELEFMVQLAQLIRGGREVALKTTSLLEALAAASALNFIAPETAAKLREAYLFLRRAENRLQMLRDEQAHVLPEDETTRARVALGLGYDDWPAFVAALDRHRGIVATEFAEILAGPRRRSRAAGDEALWRERWRALTRPGPDEDAPEPGPDDPPWFGELVQFARGAAVRGLSAKSREKLERVLPALLADAAAREGVDDAVVRLLRLLGAIAGRPTYLALLDERPAARERLLDVMAKSAFLAERVVAHPLLLDDLLDARLLEAAAPDRAELEAELERRLAPAREHGEEAELEALTQTRQSATFRLGLASLKPDADPDAIARGLAMLAEVVLAQVLGLSWEDATKQYGALGAPGAGLIVVGYGSLGGAELGFGSDLDLVFLYDAALGEQQTAGARGVEGSRFFARVAQRVVHWLTTPTRSGRLYDVDVRLRPDGAKGLLVTSLQAFADYQSSRAWVWEHQALVRARVVAGDPELARAFELVRAEVLARPRDRDAVGAEIAAMRERWRAQLDRSSETQLDLKQGRGGLVDLEFALQRAVLLDSAAHPALLATTRTRDLLARVGGAQADALVAAHRTLLARALACALDLRPRVVPRDDAVAAAAAVIDGGFRTA